MPTPAQIDANRRNAQKSTGPVTETGRNVSRFNALKTGIHAKSTVIPGEDAAELEQLAAAYHQQFQPCTPEQRFLVDTMIDAEWMLRRYHRIEAEVWEFATRDIEVGSTGEAFARHEKTFALLHRKINSLERSYYRARKALQEAQAAGQAAAEAPAPEASLENSGSFHHFPDADEPPTRIMSPPLGNPALRL